MIKAFEYSEPISGVKVKPVSRDGNDVVILYNGRLSDPVSKKLYLHYGYGDNLSWQRIGDLLMQSTDRGWEAMIHLRGDKQLNFCFKDAFENWDDNSGQNWSYRINC